MRQQTPQLRYITLRIPVADSTYSRLAIYHVSQSARAFIVMASLLGFQKEIEQREREARRTGSGKENRLPSGKSSASLTASSSTKEGSGSSSGYFKESPITSPGTARQPSGTLSSNDSKGRSGSSGSGKDLPKIEDSEDSAEVNLQVNRITICYSFTLRPRRCY